MLPRSAKGERGERIVLRRIGQAERDDAACRGPQRLRMRSLFGAAREPAHVAVLPGGEEFRQPCACFGTKFSAAEADGVEAKRQRAVADQSGCIAKSAGFVPSSRPA